MKAYSNIQTGGIQMVKNILEFFRNLPSKKCTKCGKEIEEQADCYGNTCNHCIEINDL